MPAMCHLSADTTVEAVENSHEGNPLAHSKNQKPDKKITQIYQ